MKYFTIKELCHSDTANRLRIDNVPSEDVIAHLNVLVDNILDPAREMLGSPIYVSSGYRQPTLNAIVGGDKNSQHMKGQAADIYASNMHALRDILAGMNYDQFIIYEGYGGRLNFFHISFVDVSQNRHEHFCKRTRRQNE